MLGSSLESRHLWGTFNKSKNSWKFCAMHSSDNVSLECCVFILYFRTKIIFEQTVINESNFQSLMMSKISSLFIDNSSRQWSSCVHAEIWHFFPDFSVLSHSPPIRRPDGKLHIFLWGSFITADAEEGWWNVKLSLSFWFDTRGHHNWRGGWNDNKNQTHETEKYEKYFLMSEKLFLTERRRRRRTFLCWHLLDFALVFLWYCREDKQLSCLLCFSAVGFLLDHRALFWLSQNKTTHTWNV